MDAIILAAGFGKRLRPVTLAIPKPLLPVRRRPLLDWTLGALPPVVDRVLVVVHYLAGQIEAYLSVQTHFSSWQAVRQDQPRGTGDALRACREHLRSDRFLVLNGDDLYGAADLARLAACSAGLLVHPVNKPKEFGIAFTRPDGSLKELVEKPNLEGRYPANAGAYLFPRSVFDTELEVSARGEYEITDYVTALAGRQRVELIEAEFWLPIGTVEIWQAAQENTDIDRMMKGSRGT